MSDLTALSLAEAREGLRKREFSAVELVEAHLAAMEKARALNAYVLETPPQARAMAQAADERLGRADARPLEGIALGVKDMFATKDVRTTAGSRILGEFVPTYESSVTANLWRDGAVLLGKLNNDEFAMGSSNETSCFGPVISPWRRRGSNTALVPGGSSGGSAARGFHRHGRHQADLWPLLALGHRRVRLLARSGRTARAFGARCGDPPHLHGRA